MHALLRIINRMINPTEMYSNPRKAFTLIELLVVIAITAILVGLIVVVTGSMLKRAKSTKDMANHKILGATTWSFSLDNNGRLLHPRIYPHTWGPAEGQSTPEQKRN